MYSLAFTRPSQSCVLFFANCQSLLANIDNLRLMVAGNRSPPSVIALAETWLDDTIRPCELSLPSYLLFKQDRNRRGGGVAFYVESSV